MILALFFTKDLIKARFDRQGKLLWFKTDTALWRFVGAVGLAFAFFRTLMFAITKYPLYWTNLNIHICRIHIMLVFGLMIIGKFKLIKYITYISVFASLAGFYFGTEISEIVNTYANSGKTWDQAVSAFSGYSPKVLDELIFKDGFTFYNVGFDNWWLYDFVFAHLAIIFFPIFIRIAYGQKFSAKELHIMQLGYMLTFLLMWLTNALTDVYSSSPNWKMNNWYVGMKNANDYTDALGILSGWPQNLFAYSIIGVIMIYAMHFLWMYLDKFHFFTNGKIIEIQKSKHWIEFKNKNTFVKAN